jgi:hypothetical protein
MTETCCCPSEGGNAVCDLKDNPDGSAEPSSSSCPECGQKGKPVEVQTVKSMLTITLREVKNDSYRFCRTKTCPVVYFGADGNQVFTIADVRERVYQKEPKTENVLICYCFNHSVSEIRSASHDEGESILTNINAGIKAGQCACDLRNPQGSCCLGNVRALIKSESNTN